MNELERLKKEVNESRKRVGRLSKRSISISDLGLALRCLNQAEDMLLSPEEYRKKYPVK